MNLSLLAKSSKSLFRLFFVIIFFLFSFEISFADGGTVTYVDSNGQNPRSSPAYTGGYTIETFTTSGTFTVPAGVSSAEVLIVAGGGGGTVYYSAGYTGGGGAGGLLHGTLTGLSGSYDVTVGSGGASANGGNSSFGSHTALGGGYATGLYQGGAASGGSGGGSCCASSYSGSAGAAATQGNSSPLTGYGNAGGAGHAIDGVGAWGGGGGGAGGAGGAASYPAGAGSGGAGRAYNISGATTTYAAGGYTGSGAGAANTGNGGGAGQNGGSGIVIVKYLSIDPNLPTIASATSTYITTTTAVLGATIESIGGSSITDRGICYGVSASSTTCTSEGSVGTGSYSLQIFGLATSTTYYYYAYAVNSYGTSTTVGAYFTTEGLTNSLMFDSASSQYLSRTFSTPTDNKKWTWSGWIKRSSLVADGDEIFNAGQSGSNDGYLRFNSSNGITFGTYTGGGTDYGISTSAVFRDPSIWYHITVVYDSANANAADRGIIYVNGVRQTVSNAANGIWPQNFSSSPFNTAVSHSLMSDYQRTSGLFNDGYLSDVNFVDGQALTPSYFGKSDSNTGNWTPKAYQGTYGVNGFHLTFSSSTSLGLDISGNGNTWTTNGGITSANNQVIDTPLNNFATLNPNQRSNTLSVSKGNLSALLGGGYYNIYGVMASMPIKDFDTYFEAKLNYNSRTISSSQVGVVDWDIETNRNIFQTSGGSGSDAAAVIAHGGGDYIKIPGSSTSDGVSYTTSDTIMVAVSPSLRKVWFGKNGTWNNGSNPANNTGGHTFASSSVTGYFPIFRVNPDADTESATLNFGQKSFTYNPPAGFKTLSTANLPTPAILKPNQHFDVATYTANGLAQVISGLNFQPDFVWIKNRTSATSNRLVDSTRGATKSIQSDVSGISNPMEQTETTGLTSFISNGFEIGTDADYNTSSNNYISWNWKESTTAGLDVVMWTGNNGTWGNSRTVSHSLSSVPEFIIAKNLDKTDQWIVYHHLLTGGANAASVSLHFNENIATYTNSSYKDWAGTMPTDTQFSVDGNILNNNNQRVVAYAFSEVPGYSKFGSYTGNGSSDGSFVYTGFKPRYIMIKRTDSANEWTIIDTARNTYNPLTTQLYANQSTSDTTWSSIDSVSNGFKIRSSNGESNASGGTYIYAAFAELPMIPTVPSLPTLSSPTSTSTTETTAVLGGTVDTIGSTNVTARGVCYGSAPAPTTNCTAGTGTSTGVFTVSITGLATSTTYYYRAYATNSYGTAYSSDSTFTTEGLTNSLMFDSSQSQYLSRTFSTPTDNKKWTWSGWVKRSKLSSGYPALFAFPGTTDELIFYTNDLLQYYNNAAVSSNLLSNQMFRDSATFVHVTLAVDTTQSTASDRVKIYINGSQMTSLSQTSYPSLNYSQGFNSAGLHQIGKATGAHYFDGYLSDIYFVDGQQLTPTNFGKTDGTTGNWIPKKYTGTYGNNGFHLQFNNAGLLGADTSGNGNHWSLNGGITQANNQVTDTPLNNFTTWNGLLKPTTGSPTYSAGNLKWSNTSSDTEVPVYANVPTTGKWYAEFKCTTIVAGCTFFMHDFYKESTGRPYWNYTGPGSHSNQKPAYYMNGNIYHSGGTLVATSFTSNDVISIAYDADTGKVWFAKNGAWQNSGNPSAGTGQVDTLTVGDDVAMGAMGYQSTVVVANFGQRGFSYTPPTGFKALSSANLPVPTILKPNRHFDAVTYSGSNSTQSITSLSFKPDFVWIKSRSTADSHALFDAVRTSSNGSLSPNTSGAEDTTGRFTSFDSYGFTLPSGGWGMTNASGQNFVAWNWKGGNSTTTNTSGTITSTVSANPTAGFSVVTYTGNATAGQTIGHGLGAEPTFMIIKSRGSQVWNVYHKAVGATSNTILQIDSSSGLNTGSNITISASSSTFGVGSAAQVNGNGVPFVAYVFKDIEGYSKFGKYMGNGSTDGTFVYTGFKPRYVMIKRAEAANWVVFDTLRNGYNKDPDGNATIYPGLSNAEVSNYNTIDILSNGFKMRNSSAGYNTNDSGGLFAYAAFAETTMIPTIPSLPSVSSPTATSTTETTVTLGGTVDSLGGNGSITARGTCFATTRNPTINCLPEGATTTGIFTQTRTGLATSTTYYYRAYATNSYGTAYSSDSTFTTEGLTSSLILDSSQSQYLSRTFSTPTDGKKYTFSTWVKRSKLGYEWDMFTSGSGAGTDSIYFSSSDDAIIIRDASSGLLKRTAQVFRDPSKWYHIVLAVDTTQSTADNRNRLYIDGVENTSWVTNTTNSTQDAANNFNSAQIHRLGAYASGGYGEGYQSDTNFVDGQQLTPSSFGQADSNTGNWIPKSYTGSYGTNGFRLKFNNANSLGQDTSGNNNNWSLNGGITQANNQVTDTPLNNFATLNPLDKAASNITLSKGNLKAAFSTNYVAARSTMFVSSGSWYLECTAEDVTDNGYCGIATSTEPLSSGAGAVGTTAGWGIRWDVNSHETYHNGTYASAYSGTPADGDVYMMAFNMDTGKIWLGRNGTWFASGDPSAGTNPAYTDVSGLVSPMIGGGVSGSLGINFGQKAFAYTPPTGYKALSTANLPVPNILKPNQHFDTVTYTGNSSSKSISTLNFKPDLVWIKGRSYGSSNHIWNDAVRGPNKTIFSNQSLAEYTDRGVESFDTNGFSMSGTEGGDANADTQTYVAWNWKGGNATTTNTSGSITSTVSANPTAGFSIINYTGTGSNGTVGHGLGSIPNFIIFKQRSGGASSGVQDWGTYHSSIGPTGAVRLSTNNANVTNSTYFNNATPTATVINLGSFQNYNELNGNFITYAFTEVSGYSKFGSYTGNGSADGPFIYTGFKPRWIMIKRTNTLNEWAIIDTARNTYNPLTTQLYANQSIQDTTWSSIDSLSNGFKLRSNNGESNGASDSYIYAAFAESIMIPTATPISTTTIMLSNVTLTPGDAQVNIGYYVPENPNFSEVVVLRSSSGQVTDTPVDGTSYSAGNTIGSATVACVDSSIASSTFDSCTSSSLTNNTTYYFKVFTKNSDNIYTAIPLADNSSTPGVSSVDLSLSAYRIREDNGDEFSATYTNPENTPITNNFIVGDKKRIRFVVSNQTTSLTSKRYQIEYSITPCTSWTVLPKATESTNQHFRIEQSNFLNDGSATTHSSGLSVPGGKTFTPGKIQSFNNLTDPITLRSNEYTEIEYSIRSTPHITPNTEYCFRLTGSGDSAGFTYTNIPQFTSKISAFRPQSGGGGGSRYIAPIVGQAITAAVEESATTTAPVVSGGGQSGGGIVATNTEQIATTTAPQQSTSTNTKVKDSGGDSGNLQIKNEFALIKDTTNFLSLFIKELANYQLKSTAINAYAYQECNLKGLIFIKTGECEHLDMYGDNKSKLNLNILWSVFNKIEEIGK